MRMFILMTCINTEEEKEKLKKIYLKYKKLMFKIAFEILQDFHCAEEAVEEAGMKIINNLDKFSDIDSTNSKNLAAAIVKNTAKNMAKYRSKFEAVDLESKENNLEDNKFSPEIFLLSRENAKQIVGCISQLDEKYGKILWMKYIDNIDDREICKTLDISPENFRVRLCRGNKILNGKLKNRNLLK